MAGVRGRKGGQIGGKRRLKTMTKEQRSKVAKRAAEHVGRGAESFYLASTLVRGYAFAYSRNIAEKAK